MNCLYILVAPSAVGKSALLHQLKGEKRGSRFLWRSIKKYSTRDCRGVDRTTGIEDDVVDIDGNNDELISAKAKLHSIEIDYEQRKKTNTNVQEDEINVKNARDALFGARVKYIEQYCNDTDTEKKGVVYHMNTNLYGFNYQEICECLKTDNGVIICSDFDTIRTLKNNKEFGKFVKVIYIASSMDEKVLLNRYKGRMGSNEQVFAINQEGLSEVERYNNLILSAGRLGYYEKIEETIPKLNEIWNSMLVYYSTICNRKEKIRLLFNQYIENVGVIDNVILNFYDLEYMYSQMRNIIIKNNTIAIKTKVTAPPIFMVCAAPSSGKGTLMEIVGDIGKIDGSLVQVKKYAKRNASPLTDRRDNMVPIGKSGQFEQFMPIEAIWKWVGHKSKEKGGVSVEKEYAVNKKEISENLINNKSQIFIANFNEIANARKYFPNNIVVLYLHATHDTETKKHIERKRRFECRSQIIDEAKKSGEDLSDKEVTEREQSEKYVKLKVQMIAADLEEIRSTHNDYVKYITEVDHVLLNTGTQDDLIMQMQKILKIYSIDKKV